MSALIAAPELLSACLLEAARLPASTAKVKAALLPSGRRILKAPAQTQMAVFQILMERIGDEVRQGPIPRAGGMTDYQWRTLRDLADRLARRPLPFNEDRLSAMLNAAPSNVQLPWEAFLTVVERYLETHELTPPLREPLLRLCPTLALTSYFSYGPLLKRLQDRLAGMQFGIEVDLKEALSPLEQTELAAMDSSIRTAWTRWLAHAASLQSAAPKQAWLETAREYCAALGLESVREWIGRRLSLSLEPDGAGSLNHPLAAVYLRGILESAAVVSPGKISRELGVFAEACFKKIPGRAPRAEKIGNSCLRVLGSLPPATSVPELLRLKHRVKSRKALASIEKYLAQAAERSGETVEDIEETSLPTYGLNSGGTSREQFGDFSAELTLENKSLRVQWSDAQGRRLSAVPAAVRKEFAEEYGKFQENRRAAETMLGAFSRRLESLYLKPRAWKFALWWERMIEPPISGHLARQLIWQLKARGERRAAIFSNGKMVDVLNHPLEEIIPETEVSLWHPLEAPESEASGWDHWLQDHGTAQPFKQARRETYRLSAQERHTNLYSDRFKGHLLTQSRFSRLCQERRWRYAAQGIWDTGQPMDASLALPSWDLTAHFWVNIPGNDIYEPTAKGLQQIVSSDQIRFTGANGSPVPLAQVPPAVFSEILRDIELFVTVASIGNDPEAKDFGAEGPYQAYREMFSFGELSEFGLARRKLLELLVPRLSLSSRCGISDRFLVIRGRLRTYKIHIGSGHAQMSPGARWLPVPSRLLPPIPEGDAPLLLVFEKDSRLSEILQSAYLLMDDENISDPVLRKRIEEAS